jgi:hypothetical protein
MTENHFVSLQLYIPLDPRLGQLSAVQSRSIAMDDEDNA